MLSKRMWLEFLTTQKYALIAGSVCDTKSLHKASNINSPSTLFHKYNNLLNNQQLLITDN